MQLDTDQGDAHSHATAAAPTGVRGLRRATAGGLVLAVAALSLAGCLGGGGDDKGASAASSPGQASSSATRATFSLSVGLQPGHLTEKVVLKVDGQQLADWTTSGDNPSRIITLSDVPSGDVRYELSGSYATYNAKGIREEKPVKGGGTIAVANGGFYGLYYDTAADTFELQRLR